MRRIVLLFILFSLLLVQNGCNIKQRTGKQSAFDGIVISDNGSSLMVAVSGKGDVLSPFEPASVFYDKAEKESFSRGTLIRIIFDGSVRESYPVQITAKDITVIQKVKDNWPPTLQLEKDYSPEEAKEDGCYVENLNENKNETLDMAVRFQQNASQGICAYLRKVSYTVEGDPIITDFIYDGIKFYVVTDSTRDSYGGTGSGISSKEYSYLNTSEKDGRKVIYLANKEQVSQEEYEAETLDTFTVYSE